jgi:multiple sugar transport system permease protein
MTMNRFKEGLFYLILTFGGLVIIFPFLWMLATSFKTGVDVYNMSLIPKVFSFQNYLHVIKSTNFLLWFKNSLIVAGGTTASVLFFDTLVGYTFAKLNFKGKNFLFFLVLSTLMIPTEMLVIPWYLMSSRFGWANTYWSLLFPGLTSAFGIFLMRQFFEALPNDLLEASRIDGLSEFGIFLRVGVPLVKPALSALGIFTFLGNWNAFLWPVIVVDKPEIYTLPVGLAQFSGELINQWDLIMTGASIATIPVLIVFFIFQKQIIEGIHMTGIKD